MEKTETAIQCDSNDCGNKQTFEGLSVSEEAQRWGWIYSGNHHFCSIDCKLQHRHNRLASPKFYPTTAY